MNGDELEIQRQESIADLLTRLGIDARRVAVEHNFEIIPKARYSEIHLSDGDHLEVVHFVGGG